MTGSRPPVPDMPMVHLPAPWVVREKNLARTRLRLALEGSPTPIVTLTRCLASSLRDAYPVSTHDIAVELFGAGGHASRLLADVTDATLSADTACRRLVAAIPAERMALIAEAESAGYRYVVDVDVDGQELSLLVAEPTWVTEVDMHLGHVPGS